MSDRGEATEGNPIVVGIARLLLFALFKADYVYFFEMPNWFLKAESAINYLNLSQLVFAYQKFENYRVWYREKSCRIISPIY